MTAHLSSEPRGLRGYVRLLAGMVGLWWRGRQQQTQGGMTMDDEYDDAEDQGFDDEAEMQEESEQTGLPPGSCGYCGGAHHIDEHATDGELAYDYRQSQREPDPPFGYDA